MAAHNQSNDEKTDSNVVAVPNRWAKLRQSGTNEQG